MGGGAGLIVGIPFVVAILALLVIFRRERHRRQAGLGPGNWLRLYRLIAVAIVLFVAYLVWGVVYGALTGRLPR